MTIMYQTQDSQDANILFLKDVRQHFGIVVLIVTRPDTFGNGKLAQFRRECAPLQVLTDQEYARQTANKEMVYDKETGFRIHHIKKGKR